MATPLSVLVLEDNPDDADLLIFELRRAGFRPEWRRVDSRAGFLAALDEGPAVILADYSLPQFSALDALDLLRTSGHSVPMIVVSGAMSEEACVEALRHGAVDYLLKDRLIRLGSAVEHAVAERALIADRQRAEADSLEHERRFRAAFDHAPVGMLVTDGDGHVLEVNRALCEMVGCDAGSARLRNLGDVLSCGDRTAVAEHVKRLVVGEAEPSFEVRLRHAGGQEVWGQYSASLIADSEPPRVVHQIADITDRRRAERELQRQAEQLARTNSELQELDRLKSEFVATVSHELRTPLTSIRGYTEILADDQQSRLGGTEREIVGIIDRNGQRLLTLIEDLLTFSRIEAGTLNLARGPVRLATVVDHACEAIRPLVSSSGLSLTVDIPPGLPVIDADQSHLERVLLNLLSNAVKFSAEGGAITVRAEATPEEVRVSVADDGIGIAEEDRERVFQRFYRTADAQLRAIQGSGLGLAIGKAVVEAHGGHVSLESVLGRGTRITVALPILA